MSSSPEISLQSIVVRAPEQVSGELEGKVVLLSIQNGEYYNMNEVGSRIWELIEKPAAVATVIEALLAEFEVERGTCEREALAFLEQLRRDNLLRIERGAS